MELVRASKLRAAGTLRPLGFGSGAVCVLGTNTRFPPSFSWSCASRVPVNEALAHLKRRNPMILMITHKAARLLAIQDAKRAMRQSDYDGVSFSCCEAFEDYRFEGLGDVLILNPGATVDEDVVQTYQAAYLEAWHRA
jgi:hypothetical protein